jgi:hypothetical protein
LPPSDTEPAPIINANGSHDGQFAHTRHAQIARRASLSQAGAVANFGKSEA